MLETILKVCGAITAVGAVVVLGRKTYSRLRPATAALSCRLVFDGSKPDSMTVAVTNRSPSNIYLRSCVVRSTHPLRRLLGLETRYELDGFLKTHQVSPNITIEDLRRDVQDLKSLGL